MFLQGCGFLRICKGLRIRKEMHIRVGAVLARRRAHPRPIARPTLISITTRSGFSPGVRYREA